MNQIVEEKNIEKSSIQEKTIETKHEKIKTLRKNIKFNYFESNLIVDDDIMRKIVKNKESIKKIKALNKKKYTERQQKLLDDEEIINTQYDRLYNYKATSWNMKPLIEYIYDEKMKSTAINLGDVIAEIEPDSIKKFDDNIIGFQLTKMRDNMLPAKKKIGKTKEDIKLTDEEYIGDFVGVLYDSKYDVLMIQSNAYGLSTGQIQTYLTELRKKYLDEINDSISIRELECELRVLIDPKKVDNVLKAKYFRKLRIKGSDYMLDSIIDKKDKGLLSKTRKLLGNQKGINFDITISLTSTEKTESLDLEEVEELIKEFNKFEGQEKKPEVEITKRDNEDSKVDLVNLLYPRVNSIINFEIIPRKSIGNEFLYDKMKEEYDKTRGVIARIIPL